MENKIITPDIIVPRRQLLIVDDEKALVNVLIRIMRSDLITAIGTTSPHEAKDFINNNLNTGDVVLSDFHMPEMNGLELAEITAEIRRQKAIKFFIMSGAAEFTGEAQKIKNAIGTHIDGYTAKPFDISELRQLLLGA